VNYKIKRVIYKYKFLFWGLINLLLFYEVKNIYSYYKFEFNLVYFIYFLFIIFILNVLSIEKFNLKSIFLTFFIMVIYIPGIVFLFFSKFNIHMFLAYNISFFILLLSIYSGFNLKIKSFISFKVIKIILFFIFYLIVFNIIIKGLQLGVFRYILNSNYKIDFYYIRDLFYSNVNNQFEAYLYSNYMNFFGVFTSLFAFAFNKNKVFKYLPGLLYFISLFVFGHKSAFFYFFLAIFVYSIYSKKYLWHKINFKKILLFFILISSIIFLYGRFYNVNFFVSLISMLGRRLLFTPARIAEAYFTEFANNEEYLNFRNLLKLPAKKFNQMTLPYYIADKYFNSKAHMNVNFIGSSFTQYGYFAVVIYSYILGKIIRLYDNLISHYNIDDLKKVSYASVIPVLMPLANTKLTTTIFTFGIFVSLVVFFSIAISK